MDLTSTPVLFTIDTEPDNQWADHRNMCASNVGFLKRLQALFTKHGVKPTYLLTYAIASDPEAVQTLQSLSAQSDLEIGAHLHPWDNPPFQPTGYDREYQVFPHDLSVDEFKAKLETLTEIITKNFPVPRIYRAGRFGFIAEHIKVLEECGYLADASVTPKFDRGGKYGLPPELGGRGGLDFLRAPINPYFLDYNDETKAGGSKLVEIPLTVNFTRRIPACLVNYYHILPVMMIRLLRKSTLARPVAAQPTQFDLNDLIPMLNVALAQKMPVLNFTFHSSEVMPGGSPRFTTESSINLFYEKLEKLLVWLSAASVQFMTASEATHHLIRRGLILKGNSSD